MALPFSNTVDRTLERLDVSKVKLLSLRVDYATQGDIQDHANWCDAVLLK
jgi:hypothetical protein